MPSTAIAILSLNSDRADYGPVGKPQRGCRDGSLQSSFPSSGTCFKYTLSRICLLDSKESSNCSRRNDWAGSDWKHHPPAQKMVSV
eukprot:scaffold584_cov132-Cylindrotheca_fusiformis.AAC.31